MCFKSITFLIFLIWLHQLSSPAYSSKTKTANQEEIFIEDRRGSPKKKEDHKTDITNLPDEVLLHIFSFANPVTQVKASEVCRLWYSLVCDMPGWVSFSKFKQGKHEPSDLDNLARYSIVFLAQRNFELVCSDPLIFSYCRFQLQELVHAFPVHRGFLSSMVQASNESEKIHIWEERVEDSKSHPQLRRELVALSLLTDVGDSQAAERLKALSTSEKRSEVLRQLYPNFPYSIGWIFFKDEHFETEVTEVVKGLKKQTNFDSEKAELFLRAVLQSYPRLLQNPIHFPEGEAQRLSTLLCTELLPKMIQTYIHTDQVEKVAYLLKTYCANWRFVWITFCFGIAEKISTEGMREGGINRVITLIREYASEREFREYYVFGNPNTLSEYEAASLSFLYRQLGKDQLFCDGSPQSMCSFLRAYAQILKRTDGKAAVEFIQKFLKEFKFEDLFLTLGVGLADDLFEEYYEILLSLPYEKSSFDFGELLLDFLMQKQPGNVLNKFYKACFLFYKNFDEEQIIELLSSCEQVQFEEVFMQLLQGIRHVEVHNLSSKLVGLLQDYFLNFYAEVKERAQTLEEFDSSFMTIFLEPQQNALKALFQHGAEDKGQQVQEMLEYFGIKKQSGD